MTQAGPDLSSALARGVDFLAARQLASGQFPIEATFHNPPQSPVPDASVFSTTHIVYSLGFVPGPKPAAMISRALDYFRRERSPHALWRYWNKDAVWGGRAIRNFIPADADDTANISFLLQSNGIPVSENRRLLLLNRNRDGLFYTWLVFRLIPTIEPRYWMAMLGELRLARMTAFWRLTEAGYRDIDGVVNANVLLYLGQCPETRAAATWLREVVRRGDADSCDKWYRDPFSFYYAFSRVCLHHRDGVLIEAGPEIALKLRESAQRSGQIGESVLQTALAVNTLLNLGRSGDSDLVSGALMFLAEAQSADGSWPSAPYYYGGPKKAVSWGSAELTTGLCLEALSRGSLPMPVEGLKRSCAG